MTYTILSAQYANEDNTAAVIMTAEAAGVLISVNDTPEEWAAMLEWGTPEAFQEPTPPPPAAATKLGLKRAAAEMNRWAAVKAAIESNPDVAEDWNLAVEIRRDDPIFTAFVASGSFTEEEIDAVFRRAVEIVA